MIEWRNKKINIVLIIIVLIALGALYYKFNRPSGTDSQIKTNKNTLQFFPADLLINKESLTAKPTWYKEINAEYPVGDMVGVKDIENFVRKEGDQLWCANDEENLTEQQTKDQGLFEIYKCSLSIKYSYSNSKNLLTHKLGEYGMYGGTHGIYSAVTFTYDVNGNSLTLSDLAANKDTYRKTISNKLKEGFMQLQKSNSNYSFDYVLDEITKEDTIDSLAFMATSDGLVFLFSETNGLSYGLGEIEVKIPFTDLIGVLQNKYLN